MAAPRSLGDVLDDLQSAFRTENGPEFHRLVQMLHLSITPVPEVVSPPHATILQPFAPSGPLTDFKPPLDPHLQHIERMLLHGLYYLSAIYAQNRRLLMNAADINAKLDRIDQATNNIAADIRFLITEIGTGMTQAQVDAVGARLETSAAALETIASSNQPPVAVPPPVPPPPGTVTPVPVVTGAPVTPPAGAAAVPDGSTFSGETGADTTGRVPV